MGNRMTTLEFRNWLLATYGIKQPRDEFLADFNAIARSLGEQVINWAKVNHWMYDRQPPWRVGGLTFERVLELIVEQRRYPRAMSLLYVIALRVDSDTARVIKEQAEASGVAPEEWLRATLREMLARPQN